MAREDLEKKLASIPVPFSDVKNILKEIYFTDETTRSRSRGWLVLPSRRYLQADILFPGCEFDCRLTIRERTCRLRGNTLNAWMVCPSRNETVTYQGLQILMPIKGKEWFASLSPKSLKAQRICNLSLYRSPIMRCLAFEVL